MMNKHWLNPKIYTDLFGTKIDLNKDNRVIALRKLLNTLPEQDTYDVITYGSLMNANDINRTMPSVKDADMFPAALPNYKRIFNVGYRGYGSYLNIQEGAQDGLPLFCIGITVKAADLPSYIVRESLYSLKHIEFYSLDYKGNIETDENGIPYTFSGLTVINNEDDYGLEPKLNYFHLCLHGIQCHFGKVGVDNFLDTTLCYSVKQSDYITAREWLSEVDLKDLMIRQIYQSR